MNYSYDEYFEEICVSLAKVGSTHTNEHTHTHTHTLHRESHTHTHRRRHTHTRNLKVLKIEREPMPNTAPPDESVQL